MTPATLARISLEDSLVYLSASQVPAMLATSLRKAWDPDIAAAILREAADQLTAPSPERKQAG